jgi:hypothetical protein
MAANRCMRLRASSTATKAKQMQNELEAAPQPLNSCTNHSLRSKKRSTVHLLSAMQLTCLECSAHPANLECMLPPAPCCVTPATATITDAADAAGAAPVLPFLGSSLQRQVAVDLRMTGLLVREDA